MSYVYVILLKVMTYPFPSCFASTTRSVGYLHLCRRKHREETGHLMGQQKGIHRKAEWADLSKAVEETGLLPAPLLNESKGLDSKDTRYQKLT